MHTIHQMYEVNEAVLVESEMRTASDFLCSTTNTWKELLVYYLFSLHLWFVQSGPASVAQLCW